MGRLGFLSCPADPQNGRKDRSKMDPSLLAAGFTGNLCLLEGLKGGRLGAPAGLGLGLPRGNTLARLLIFFFSTACSVRSTPVVAFTSGTSW